MTAAQAPRECGMIAAVRRIRLSGKVTYICVASVARSARCSEHKPAPHMCTALLYDAGQLEWAMDPSAWKFNL